MSLYQFFASDKPLLAYDNKVISCDEKNRLTKKTKITESSQRFNITEIDELLALRIILEDDMYYAKMYTNKPYCAYIEWRYSDKNAEGIIKYIQQHLKSNRTIELWNAWMGDKEEVIYKNCNLEALTIKDIKEIWGKTEFNNPECLKIYRQF